VLLDPASKHFLAERLANVLRRFEHEGRAIEALARAVGETPRDLRRWADGVTLPGHVPCALLGELPRHLADELIRPTGLRLESINRDHSVNALLVAAKTAAFSSAIAERHADGNFCHRDRAVICADAERLISKLQKLVEDYSDA
jgi:hypothetical protein